MVNARKLRTENDKINKIGIFRILNSISKTLIRDGKYLKVLIGNTEIFEKFYQQEKQTVQGLHCLLGPF